MDQQTWLLLDLARLIEADEHGMAWFALTLAPALKSKAPLARPAELQPWLWTRADGKVKLFKVDGTGGTAITTVAVEPLQPGPGGDQPAIAPLSEQLGAVLEELETAAPERLVFDPAAADPAAAAGWPHLLLEAARLPAPIGQHAGLVWLFKVEASGLPGAGGLFAAPIFAIDGAEYAPGDAAAAPAADGTIAIDYAGPDRKVTARGPVLDLAKAPPDLWLAPARTPWGGKNWMAALPYETAAAANLAQHLVDATEAVMRDEPGGGTAPVAALSGDEARWLRRAFLLALRLAGHSGVAPASGTAPDPVSALPRTAADLLRRSASGTEAEIAAMLAALVAYEDRQDLTTVSADPGPVKDWCGILAEVLRDRAPAFVRDPRWLDAAPAMVPLGAELETLRALLGAAREPDRLRELVLAHWQVAKLEPSPSVTDIADGMPLVARLALDRLDTVWRAMVRVPQGGASPGPDEIGAIRAGFREALCREARSRLVYAPDPAGDFAARVGAALEARIADLADGLGPETLAADADVALGPGGPTRTAHPLVVTLQGLRTEAPGAGEAAGLSAQLAGLGVLMRPRPDAPDAPRAPWRCLTLGSVSCSGQPILGLGLAPWRIAELGGLETWSFAYDNHPLTARSLANRLVAGGVEGTLETALQSDEGSDDPVHLDTAVMQVRARDDDPLTQIPALRFGRTYELAAFGVTNCGALPRQLWQASGGGLSPLTLRLPGAEEDLPPDRVVAARYLRRVPVGAPRLLDAAGHSPFKPTRILAEDGLFPLADDLLADEASVPAGAGQPGSEPVSLGGPRPARDAGPILLLAQPADLRPAFRTRIPAALSFAIRPPAVDLQVWHRWVANDLPSAAIAQVYAGFYRSAPRPDPHGNPSAATGADLSIDDPAVEQLQLSLIPIAPAGKPSTARFALPRPGGDGLGSVQAAALGVDVAIGTLEGVAPRNGRIAVTVRAGCVYRLAIASLVRSDLFLGGKRERFRGTAPSVDGDWAQAAVTALTIEVVTTAMPTAQQLRHAIAVLGRRGRELVVGLDPADVAEFAAVKQVTLESQQWRWTGRRLPRHFPLPPPAAWAKDDLYAMEGDDAQQSGWDEVRDWDIAGFGDRADSDRRVRPGLLPGAPGLGGGPLVRGAALHAIDLEADPRALYLRYRATATSRYAGILAAPPSQTTVRTVSWRRLLVKSRLARPPAKPKVRFLLPLTQPLPTADGSAPMQSGAASVLLILDETWSSDAGLVERLDCQVVDTRYTPPGQDAVAWPEYGFDPIETAATPARGKGMEWLPDVSTGLPPFGLTLDVGASLQHPAATCFEIRVTEKSGMAGTVRPNVFAKIRFRKSIEPRGSADDMPLESGWTDPYWIQLLADFAWWRAVNPRTGVAALAPVTALRFDRLGIMTESGDRAVLLPTAADDQAKLRRRVLLLLTRLVREADGYRTSEVPLALGQQDDAGQIAWSEPVAASTCRLRLLEVEHHAAKTGRLFEAGRPLTSQPLWDALFGDVPDLERARLSRVSPVIEGGVPPS